MAGVQDIIDMCVYIYMLTKNEGESYHRRGPEGSGSGKDGGRDVAFEPAMGSRVHPPPPSPPPLTTVSSE